MRFSFNKRKFKKFNANADKKNVKTPTTLGTISIGFDLVQHNVLYPRDKSCVLNFETHQRSCNRSMGYGWNAVIELSIG